MRPGPAATPPGTPPTRSSRHGHVGPASDPLAGVELVLVDGNNLVGDRRLPPGAVIGPIRGAIPAGVRVELIFDGPPRGGVTGRLATGFAVRYSGRSSADSLILDVITRQGAEHGPAATWSILVVTDDRDLRDAARFRGARTAAAGWLAARAATASGAGGLGRGGTRSVGGGVGATARARSGTSIGHGRPPRRPDRDAC